MHRDVQRRIHCLAPNMRFPLAAPENAAQFRMLGLDQYASLVRVITVNQRQVQAVECSLKLGHCERSARPFLTHNHNATERKVDHNFLVLCGRSTYHSALLGQPMETDTR